LQSFTFDNCNSSPKSHPAIILQQLSGVSSSCRVFYSDFHTSTLTSQNIIDKSHNSNTTLAKHH
jgi:hypothetical protein